MSDELPSIAELQAAQVRDKFSDEALIIDAAPVLLAIATAALRIQGWHDGEDRSSSEFESLLDELMTATMKVRP